MRALIAALLAAASTVAAAADSVALQGMLGNRALLIVNGSAPRSVAPGETHMGVKVLTTLGDQAVVEIEGRRHTLRVGDAPATVGGPVTSSRGTRIVLPVSSNGHFISAGSINGKPVNFLVDTGASTVSMGAMEAQRLGIDFRKGQQGQSSTANGVVPNWRIKLASVRIGDVEIYEVDASVLPGSMPYVLLGNSFLSRFDLKRNNDQLVLDRRY
ncbi:MAG: retropepsin-like aspartic protease family protein [Ramlibacter sp.]